MPVNLQHHGSAGQASVSPTPTRAEQGLAEQGCGWLTNRLSCAKYRQVFNHRLKNVIFTAGKDLVKGRLPVLQKIEVRMARSP